MTRTIRRQQSPSERQWFDEMVGPLCTELYRSVREVLAEGGPLDLELATSSLIAMWQGLPLIDEDAVEAFGGAVIRRARKRDSAEAYALLTGLAAVAPPTLDRRAREAAKARSRHAARVPAWVGEVGRARFVGGWVAGDVYGDQESVLASFAYDGDRDPHTLVVLVDHNLGGVVKDAFVVPRPLAETAEAWLAAPDLADDADLEIIDGADAAEVARRLRPALELRDRCVGLPASETMRECEALLAARLRGLPRTPPPQREDLSADERDALLEEFLASPEAAGLRAADLAEFLIDFKCDHVDGAPLRWSPPLVGMCLVEWFPRKITLDEVGIDALPAVLRSWVRFAGRRRGQRPDLVGGTLFFVDLVEADYRKAMTDPERFGMAKSLFHTMAGEGVDPTDQAQVDAWIAGFNQRPEEERRALLRT